MASCAECSATLYGDAEWCLQCFTPVRVPALVGSGGQIVQHVARSALQNDVVSAWAPAAPAAPVPMPISAKQAEGRVAGPRGLILAIGFLFQVGAYAYSRWGNAEPSQVINVGMWVTLGFYGVVLAIVAGTSRRVDFLPLWSRGHTGEGVAVGVFGGVVTAAVVLLLLRGADGRLQVAPDVKFALGDATLLHVLLAVAVLVVAAPVVEELLFRGFVAEAMRHRGAVIALLVSGVLFALWHMRLGGLVYYT